MLSRFKARGLKWLGHMLLPVLLSAFAALAYQQQWFYALDVLLYDTAQRLRPGTVVPNSVIVAIDEHSIEQLGRWPWQRSVHAQLITLLADYEVETVVFDVLFADTSVPEQDLLLAQALAYHGGVVLPLSIEPLSSTGQLVEVVPTMQLFSAAQAVGHAHIDCDYDGVCRSLYLREGLGEATWPHLSASLIPANALLPGARSRQHNPMSPLWIYRDYHNYIPFSPHDKVPVVSYVDVLEGRLPPQFFNGKTVFVGAMAAGVHDILTTPVGRMPGVEITALIHHHLQAGTLIQRLHSGIGVGVIAAFLVALLGGLSQLAPRPFLVATLLVVVMQCVAAFTLLLWGHRWLAIAPVIVATLFFYPLWSWLRLELAMAYLQRALVLRQQNPPSVSGLLKDDQTLLPHTPWLLASDTVARTVSQLDVVSAAQEAAHQLLQQSVSGLQEGCIIFADNGECYLTNTLAQTWFPNWQSSDVRDLAKHLQLPMEDWVLAISDVVAGGKALRCEAQSIDGGGTQVSYFVQVKRCLITLPHRAKPVIVGVLTLTDISALKASERAREETLNFISHDLRSPLVSILSLITHQRDAGGELSDIPVLLNDIERYANRNLAYSESLLQLSRAEQYASVQQAGLCDLLAVCEDAFAQVQPFAQNQACPIRHEYGAQNDAEQEYWVMGDYELLQRAVVNLLTNAIKYGTSSQGVILLLRRHDSDTTKAELSVQDFGAGMTVEQQTQAFERFTRRALPASSGAGLGLFFVKTVITRHGGNVTLQSSPSKGCCVTCTLPLHPLDFLV